MQNGQFGGEGKWSGDDLAVAGLCWLGWLGGACACWLQPHAMVQVHFANR